MGEACARWLRMEAPLPGSCSLLTSIACLNAHLNKCSILVRSCAGSILEAVI